jgi:hypothetical protein
MVNKYFGGKYSSVSKTFFVAIRTRKLVNSTFTIFVNRCGVLIGKDFGNNVMCLMCYSEISFLE